MAFKADTYRVLIASPSDLTDERQAATEAVNDWNAQHAAAEHVVLLPVKWETHATPQSGIRPQEAINQQLVEDADILIGLFWTKLGTNTGVAASGTVEEIDQFVAARKPAMLYFSNRPIDPSRIDIDQHGKLTKFKDETYKRALVGSFKSPEELRATLLRDLMAEVRRLRAVPPAQDASAVELAYEQQEEVRAAQAQRAREEFEERLRQNTFREFRAEGGILAVSVIPAGPPRKPLTFGVSNVGHLRTALPPLRMEYGTVYPDAHSIVTMLPDIYQETPTATSSPKGLTELTDRGSIFAAENWWWGTAAPSLQGPLAYSIRRMQPAIIKTIQKYLTCLCGFGVVGPWYVGLSMLKHPHTRLALDDNEGPFELVNRRVLREGDIKAYVLAVPADADLSSYPVVAAILHPIFDEVWKAYGFFQGARRYGFNGEDLGFVT